MAKFMIAHLNGGALGDARILGEREAALMHTRIQGHDPRIPGFAHGFYEQSSHGLRIIGHGGDTTSIPACRSSPARELVSSCPRTRTRAGRSPFSRS
jgi:hypothetical protein